MYKHLPPEKNNPCTPILKNNLFYLPVNPTNIQLIHENICWLLPESKPYEPQCFPFPAIFSGTDCNCPKPVHCSDYSQQNHCHPLWRNLCNFYGNSSPHP